MNKKIFGFIGLLILMNTVPALGAHLHYWPWGTALYFYWAECVLFGASALLLYAKHLIVFFILLVIMAGFFNIIDLPLWNDLRVPMTFWSLYFLCWLFYFEAGKGYLGQWLKRLHPLKNLAVYLGYMALIMCGCFFVTATIYNEWHLIARMPREVLIIFIAAAALVPTFTIGFLRIINMIGARHFLYFLLGTYHRPTEQERIVLFLDMVDSSAMAERLEAKDSMQLIASFIFDAGATFRMHGGDIVNYTGDGLVVLWPIRAGDKALASVEALQARIDKNTAYYKKTFGIVPDFRIGIHAGTVVVSQIGEEKLFLGLYGDVVNTAARLEGLNKDFDTKILFSMAVKQRISLAMQQKIKALGLQKIRGRKERIEVFTLGDPSS